tara:strand:- start:835 stop:2127 length:1293 start_codon:yes stop_codon:yes gene_type:complete
MKIIYIGMSLDFIHHGHINILEKASKYGKVILGLLTDEAIAERKQIPYLNYLQRKQIAENIKNVHKVVEQNDWDYSINLKKIKPDYFIHGDDWKSNDVKIRENVIKTLKSYGGKLIEIPYTKNISSTNMKSELLKMGVSPDVRKKSLKRILANKKILRILEAHSPLSAIIAENMTENTKNKTKIFDGFWSSSLTDSTLLGKPDIEAINISQRIININNIFDVTTKPMIVDGDTGGIPEHFSINVKALERQGVSAVIIEDKKGLKKNSLLGNEVKQEQEDVELFSEKIKMGVKSKNSEDFMIIARIESLILEKGLDDAMIRSEKYLKAGADGIMIHSRKKTPDEVFEFASKFRNHSDKTLVCVPTSFNQTLIKDFEKHKFNIVIYANQMLRASFKSMENVAQEILKHDRSFDIEKKITSIKKILKLIPGTV